jgi:osmotically-inducible protein OsmY
MSPDMLVHRAQQSRLVIPTTAGRRSDREIATDVVACLRSEVPRVSRGIVPIIRMGEVSLLGYVDSDLQRLDVQKAVQRVRGVRNVIDLMVLRPETQAHAIRLRRRQLIDHGAT